MDNVTHDDAKRPLVSVEHLKVHFPVQKGVFAKTVGIVKAVDGISFVIPRGSVFALVGESGCGKTTTAQTIAGLVNATSGSVNLSFSHTDTVLFSWNNADARQARQARRNMQFIFQDPYSSLNPRMSVQSIIEEPLIIHRLGTKKERLDRINELLAQVGLSQEYLTRYPHEFSGGQRQRIGIARALATRPEFIIADEPVSALDVSIQAQIINLLQQLKNQLSQTQLFISHDLAVVRHIADTIAVMYRGKIVESGREKDLFDHPFHPYTHLLLESVPVPGKGRLKRKTQKSADDAVSSEIPPGCAFYPRCPRRRDVCRETIPALESTNDTTHTVACFNRIE